ncbi:MAG: sulfite exporter TauE/SafE family protein [Winogradskyella sp.]|uniref:sulfite exporter TauE/SafE family protein n=1 Tax=Winogradskyella sp. TaxID=1883156 RepID=UPI000F3B24E1|nr:sulfite exporter TauE/SafE family protein [Winogradskyella sp.]RNC87222.1 MAG: sulfite exporter TauE/SafE family protein [Winogradskyella sp.]
MVYSALILGLLGSLHCVGMCGPIAFLLPLDRKRKSKRILEILSYHSGRLFTYAALGFIFGLLGKRLQLFGLQQQLSIIIGALMIVVIIIPNKYFNRYNFSKPIYNLVSKIKQKIGFQIKKKEPGTFFTLGFFNGLLPCGLVYMAVFGAIGTGSMWQGSLYMVFFGLGTIPLMTSAIYIGNFLKGTIKTRIVKLIPVFVVVIGLLFILRGLGLGIKYISPTEMVAVEQTSSKHSCH